MEEFKTLYYMAGTVIALGLLAVMLLLGVLRVWKRKHKPANKVRKSKSRRRKKR